MIIRFHPTNEEVSGVGSTVTAQFLAGLGELAAPVYTTPTGYTPVQSTLTSGSPAEVLAGPYSSGYFIRFFAGDSKTQLVTKFKMDSAVALSVARVNFTAAYNTDPDSILVLNADGTVGS
jgi:hypothetical protein